MRLPKPVLAGAVAVATVLATAIGVTVATEGTAAAATLPAHVFAPYFESYAGDSLSGLSSQSGDKFLTMAFLQTPSAGSCTPDWNGDTSMPVSSSTFGADINTIRAGGGDVIPSFGGFAADDTGTELADSCTNVASIAAAYENVITTYNVTRLDLDTEDNSLTNTAGIDRRNKAIAQVEAWAAANGRTVQFSYTLPTTTTGLAASGLNVLRNAVTNNARIDIVNIMTFDYFDGASHEMANDTETAASGLVSQLQSLFPSKTTSQLWSMVGVTEMPGVDDFGPAETFTTADATTVENWAVTKGISSLSFWALQRDNGGCPGSGASDSCSGISQTTWQFSHTFAPFSGGTATAPANDFSVSVSPGAASVAPGGSASATVATAVTSGTAQSVSLSATGAPTGATVSFTPASVTAGGSATLKVTTSASTPAGTYSIIVSGSATSGQRTSTYTLTVTGGGTTTPPPSGLLTNAGFESGSLSPWTGQPGDAVVGTPVHSGTHALLISATDSQTGEVDQTVTLAPNSSHVLTAWVQGNFAFIGVSGGASASTWTTSAGYTQLTVPFTTGASGTVTVFVHGWFAQGNVFADDISLS
ncbi:MAG TPA: carbohydrate binding domain-containing protein [Pseudonocardiaceae bacterium]|nr:carbohydrate binding domain-containing protein [Pseudonocardiaceae bacterium]